MNCLPLIGLSYFSAAVSLKDNTASSYIHNVDTIIHRQLKTPSEEDADDIKDNVEEYNRLLSDLLNCVHKKDPIAREIARKYWDKGSTQFFQEKYNGELRIRLASEFNWPDKKAQQVAQLIAKSKSLWLSFETWYNKNCSALP